jgi:micrococcal nuclease
MRKLLFSIPLVLLAKFCYAENEGSGDKSKATVHYCSDGDTCRVSIADNTMWVNVRLFGIDAPETSKKKLNKGGQPMGNDAKDFLNNLVKGKSVMITQADLDPYNRPVVEIFLGEDSVNLKMIEAGMAEMYRGKTKRIDKQKFEQAEQKAKEAKVGIWSQKTYQSPAAFRQQSK